MRVNCDEKAEWWRASAIWYRLLFLRCMGLKNFSVAPWPPPPAAYERIESLRGTIWTMKSDGGEARPPEAKQLLQLRAIRVVHRGTDGEQTLAGHSMKNLDELRH